MAISVVDKHAAAVALGRLGGLKGGPARMQALSQEERSDLGKRAARARWDKPWSITTPDERVEEGTVSDPDHFAHRAAGRDRPCVVGRLRDRIHRGRRAARAEPRLDPASRPVRSALR